MGELLGTLTVILALAAVLVSIGKHLSKQLGVRQRKWWRLIHIAFAIVYFSGVLGTLLLAAAAAKTTDRELIYAAHLFGKYCDWFMIIPGAFGSLITGIWLSVRTNWGLTRYYWIILKSLGNLGAILYGSTFMRVWFDQTTALSAAGQINPLYNPAYLHNRQMLILGTLISLAILTFLLFISVFKPWGKRKENQAS